MSKSKPANRPWGVTVLLALVLMFTGLQMLRVWTAWSSHALLASLPLRVPAAFFAASGLLWACCGVALAYGLARRTAWARRGTQAAALAYAAFAVGERWLAQTRGPQDSATPFLAGLGLLLLAGLLALLASQDVKAYYAPQTAIGVKDDKTLKD